MITRFLIVLNLIGYAWEVYVGGPGMLSLFPSGASMGQILQDGSLYPAAVLQNHEWWRIVTGAFLHGGLVHIGVNMMSLYFLGRFIEYAVGGTRMLIIYLVSMVVSGLGVVYFSAPLIPTVGASGAIFGLFGALFAIGFKLGKPGMDMIKANVGILVLNLVMTFSIPDISKAAHVAGLLGGFILTYAIYFPPRRLRPVVVDAKTGAALETDYQPPGDSHSVRP